MSLGGPTSTALNSTVRNAVNSGLHFTIAAGNSATDVSTTCNICTPQTESTPRNLEVGSAYRLSPQSPVSKEAWIKLWGITTHIQAKGSMFPWKLVYIHHEKITWLVAVHSITDLKKVHVHGKCPYAKCGMSMHSGCERFMTPPVLQMLSWQTPLVLLIVQTGWPCSVISDHSLTSLPLVSTYLVPTSEVQLQWQSWVVQVWLCLMWWGFWLSC